MNNNHYHIMNDWFDECIIEDNNTCDFQKLFLSYEIWCDDYVCEKYCINRMKLKEFLFKKQRESKYDLQIGLRLSDNCQNGSKNKPKFNFVDKEDYIRQCELNKKIMKIKKRLSLAKIAEWYSESQISYDLIEIVNDKLNNIFKD